MKENKFTFEQFCQDAKKYADPINKEGLFKIKDHELFYFLDSQDIVKACAGPIRGAKQYKIEIYHGLLKEIYNFTIDNYPQYYRKNKNRLNISEYAFLRLVCNIMGEMAFWHEFSHISRNHWVFLNNETQTKSSINKERVVEMDADIYGASMLLGRVLSIPEKTLPAGVAIEAFAIGVRGLFEVLYLNFPTPVNHKTAGYPHSQARGFNAFSFAMTSEIIEKMDDSKKAILQLIGSLAFIDFEDSILGNKFDQDAVASMVADDLDKWAMASKEIKKNSQLSFEARTIGERASTYARHIDVALSKLMG